MTTIIVKNGNWDEARAKLKTNLDAQSIELKQKVTAALSPKSAGVQPQQAPVAVAPTSARPAPARTSASANERSILARSRLRT